MKLIERNDFLTKLTNVIGTPDIKIITGVRRSGKSKLLESFKEYVSKNISDVNIIHINFNLTKFENLKEYHALESYIENAYISGKENFVMIDEVQMCSQFELAINSLHAMEKYDIYLTGSNAFLLSSDLATLFTGRTFEIKVYPFSFKEFIQYYSLTDLYSAFDRYIKEGGMSGSYLYKEPEAKYDYISDVFATLIIRDIRQKYKIRNTILMNRICDFLMDNVSNLTSARNIAQSLTNNNDKINHKTVSKYLEYLCNAFAFYKFRRYDIKGKKYLSSNDKYFLSDHTFRYAMLGTKNMDYGRILENIVAIELLRRGYEVYVGVLYKKEIDFVAIKRSEKIYIQVSDNISDERTFEREVNPLLKIKDGYPKILIARTRYDEYQYEGIKIIDIANWLVQK
ncbi:ATP-binding protein [Massilicoli timonensis]|mgnify:CR=1 FL=1|uniref:ATP-binding protein n=1 Tax=Massilicoli timonensis TaxID=2015901 RepID=UPI0015B5A0D6|nr:ATP-binding protein [Massilicoli timonensis]HIR15419.1 ATP-binding protein [Candidatus Onthosoma merdavium]